MAVRRINDLVKTMDMMQVQGYLMSPARAETDPGVFICDVSLKDWIRYVKSERQTLASRAMAWVSGKLYIVELPGRIHDGISHELDSAMILATGTGTQHLRSRGSIYVENLEHIEPDSSIGPAPGFGAALPVGVLNWLDYHTLKVEVGVSSTWPQLDDKAVQWSVFPGVEYILLIHISLHLQVCQYKLHSVVNGVIQPPVMDRTPIVNPTNVGLDSHRLLGLPAHAPIPPNFTAPNLTIDLFPIVQRITNDFQAA
ncbi:hypothetical protein AC1031_007648 [Aphanomyces cochlioides]|nr:hypothetical protein AC1031_007648 [Aphanomyces cochlioides]